MKKLTMFLMAMAFSVAASAQQYLVYNYRASYETIGAYYQKVNYSLDEMDGKADWAAYFDTFDVTKDSLKGYLVIGNCSDCGEYDVFPEFGTLYVQRKGDKRNEDVWQLEVGLKAGRFNKGVASRLDRSQADDLGAAPTSIKKLKKAWLALCFYIDGSYAESGVQVEAKGLESQQTTVYGFLGFQNVTTAMQNYGFGRLAVYVNSGSVRRTIDFCGVTTEVDEGQSCIYISNIKGCLGGRATYEGLCNEVPMWDVCATYPYYESDALVSEAPICGKWSIKLNKRMTSKYNTEGGSSELLGSFKNFNPEEDDTIYVPYQVPEASLCQEEELVGTTAP